MCQHQIDVCCLQETRKGKSDVYDSNGFVFILSGNPNTPVEWYGVGFVISPRFKQYVRGFCQVCDKIASLKVNCIGGSFAIITAYAPHNLRPQCEKLDFYDKLGNVLCRTSTNGPKFLFGDFNARIGQPRPGEQHILGAYGFGTEAQYQVEMPNRDFLMEFCCSHSLTVANTFFNKPEEEKVTYHEPCAPPMAPICNNKFSMLDLFLSPAYCRNLVQDISSDRLVSLASHHFPLTTVLRTDFPLIQKKDRNRPLRRDWTVLENPEVRRALSQSISANMGPLQVPDTDGFWNRVCCSVDSAIHHFVPAQSSRANKPWIRAGTLHLLVQRRSAREHGDWILEKQLRRETKKSAKADRAKWLEDLAATGEWAAIKRLRKWRYAKQGRLRNLQGELVSSEHRAETLAEHLEKIQWKVRPTTLVPGAGEPLGDTLQINENDFTHHELRYVIQQASSGKSTKVHDVPTEVFKALAKEPDSSLQWMLDLCNHCLRSKTIPDEWSTSSVAMLFKKGDPADANNYRPICLLSIAYKLFASLLKQRLLAAGVEDRLWHSQFGFRRGHGTEDAIFVALRKIEIACAQRHGRLCLLALDWKKAFDSINLQSLLDALLRFGIPESMVQMISGMMSRRCFYVDDCGETSARKSQHSGISQGCTLSPLLFIIMMTVLMHDAVANLNASAKEAYNRGDLADIVYADDTPLLASNDCHLQDFLMKVAEAGRQYGMELHCFKCNVGLPFWLLLVQVLSQNLAWITLDLSSVTPGCQVMNLVDVLAWQKRISWLWKKSGNIPP